MNLEAVQSCGGYFAGCLGNSSIASSVVVSRGGPVSAGEYSVDPRHLAGPREAGSPSWENKASREMATETIPTPPLEAPGDELDLVARAKTGDAAAFSVLIGRYEGKIFRLAMNITQNREDAEDVLQEAFFKAYEHLDQFQGNSKFYTWVVRIAVNQALMKLRKRKSDRTISLDEQIDTGEDMVIREVAAWDPDPEQRYSREEMNTILT
jgi:hypothetical protein